MSGEDTWQGLGLETIEPLYRQQQLMDECSLRSLINELQVSLSHYALAHTQTVANSDVERLTFEIDEALCCGRALWERMGHMWKQQI